MNDDQSRSTARLAQLTADLAKLERRRDAEIVRLLRVGVSQENIRIAARFKTRESIRQRAKRAGLEPRKPFGDRGERGELALADRDAA